MGVEKLKKRIDTLEWRYREMKRGCSTFRKAKPGPQKKKTAVWSRKSRKSGPQKKKSSRMAQKQQKRGAAGEKETQRNGGSIVLHYLYLHPNIYNKKKNPLKKQVLNSKTKFKNYGHVCLSGL